MHFGLRYHLRGSKSDNPIHLRTVALQRENPVPQPPTCPSLDGGRMSGGISSPRYHLRGSKTDNPIHLRTMALQYANKMLQPPVYPPLDGSRMMGGESNQLGERVVRFDSEGYPYITAPTLNLPAEPEPVKMLDKVRQWLGDTSPPVPTSNLLEAPKPREVLERTRQWVDDVEHKTNMDIGRRHHHEEKLQTGDTDNSAELYARAYIRDSLFWCLQSMQPAFEVVRARRKALLEDLMMGRYPMPSTASRKANWEVDWENHPGDMDVEEYVYLASVVHSEWFSDDEEIH